MIHHKKGNLFESTADALVNTVNTVGVMGKGIALQFKKLFPANFKAYCQACEKGEIKIGNMFVFDDESLLTGKKTIINFPTKTDWRKPSEYDYIKKGLDDLKKVIQTRKIKSIAIPPLGSGNGGLDWNKLLPIIEHQLKETECEIYIFQPNAEIQEKLKKERVKLTPARAMLLSVLYESVRNGEFVSEFSSEKIAYFLQRFGGEDVFRLEFQPNFYGPYSGKVKHVLYYLNGSYIMGYSSKDKKPFEELTLVQDAENEVNAFLGESINSEYREIVHKTKKFLSGFYSTYGLELLSTIDFIGKQKNAYSEKSIIEELGKWSTRKKTLFDNPRFLKIALKNIQTHLT